MWNKIIEFVGTKILKTIVDWIEKKYNAYKLRKELEGQTDEIEQSQTSDEFDRAVDDLD